jgi:hypothetical protein
MKKNYLKIVLSIALLSTSAALARAQTTFNYTGNPQTYTVPAGVTSISIEATGASGWTGSYPGGDGGYTYGELAVSPGQNLYVYVGGQGEVSLGANVPMGGGWNGGGDGMNNGSSNVVGGGGGGSDVRTVLNANPLDLTSLNSRLIVAGGGGGSTNNTNCFGGDGGGLVGQDGGLLNPYPNGTGGTQSAGGAAGGAFGQGGNAVSGSMTPWNGAGGGGWYGGGVSTAHSGGGGGSSYDGGVTAGVLNQGINTGNGDVIITPLCNSLTSSVSANPICLGAVVNLSSTSNGTGTVTWDNGITNGVDFTPTSSGTITYTATSTDIADCSFSVDLLVNDLPTVTALADNNNFCDGDFDVILTGGGADSYTWDNGAVDGVAFTPLTGITTFTVTGTDLNACENMSIIDVTVFALPTVIANSDQAVYCEGDLITLSGSGATSYVWDNAVTDGLAFTQALGSVTYSVTGTDGNSCENSDQIDVLVSPNPTITLTSTDELLGNDGSISLAVDNGTSPFTFDWDNDGTGDNDDNQNLNNVPGGSYTVIMTDATGCSVSSNVTVNSQLKLISNSFETAAYPNPTEDVTTIKVPGAFDFNVHNLLGELISSGNGSNSVTIDFSELENGTYFVHIKTQSNERTIKVIKQ